MLGQQLQLAQGFQIALTQEEESILVVISTQGIVAELAKLHSLAMVIGRALGVLNKML